MYGDCPYEYVLWEDSYGLVVVFTLMVVQLSGQGISMCIFLAFNIMNLIVVLGKFEYFPSDTTVDVLWGFPVLEVLVVRVDLNFVGGVC